MWGNSLCSVVAAVGCKSKDFRVAQRCPKGRNSQHYTIVQAATHRYNEQLSRTDSALHMKFTAQYSKVQKHKFY